MQPGFVRHDKNFEYIGQMLWSTMDESACVYLDLKIIKGWKFMRTLTYLFFNLFLILMSSQLAWLRVCNIEEISNYAFSLLHMWRIWFDRLTFIIFCMYNIMTTYSRIKYQNFKKYLENDAYFLFFYHLWWMKCVIWIRCHA